ncbi:MULTISPECIES: hypothetical protein [Streptomyces]|uniref:SRPBCC family protein n=1 Tax=Streptomyces fimbriatus TaxID=68197 RepID=A0ABW0D913_STRFI
MSTVRNVHARALPAPADRVGALLDRISAADDPLFPSPAWAPLLLDRPLAVGSAGGHGPVRHSVAEYEPGRRIRFAFDPPGNGFHELSVEPLGPGRCLLRHVLEQDMRGTERLAWRCAVRAVHGTVVEELFDNAESAVTGTPVRRTRRSRCVRLLQRLAWDRPAAIDVPEGPPCCTRRCPSPITRTPSSWSGVPACRPTPGAGRSSPATCPSPSTPEARACTARTART